MKRLSIIFFLLLIVKSFSQTSDISASYRKKTIGKNFITQEEIIAKEYSFSERIHNFYIDTLSNSLTLKLLGLSNSGKYLSNKGRVILYDLSSNRIKWSKKISYQSENMRQFGNMIFLSRGYESSRLNIENGESCWKMKKYVSFADPIANIGLGYKIKSFERSSNILEGFNLKNKAILWKREVNRDYGWNDIDYLNDSVVMIVSSGIHTINIYNGSGWDYNAITGESNYAGTVAKNVAGAIVGLATGMFVLSTGHDVITDLVSNVIIDSTDLYFASREKIVKINGDNGEIKWSYSFPKGFGSKSSIFLKESRLIIVNKGYAFMNGRQVNYGKPFIASFNKETGENIFSKEVGPLENFSIKDEMIIFILSNKISKYSMSNGALISEKSIDMKQYGELKYFAGDHLFINQKDTSFINLTLSDTTKNYVSTTQNKILILDNEFNILNQVEVDRLYVGYLKINDYKFIAKNNQTVILDKDNNKIAEINIPENALRIRNKLYVVQDKNLLEIDLTNIIN